jgi:hypothetical protein
MNISCKFTSRIQICTYLGCAVDFVNLFICDHESSCAIRLRRRSGSGEEKGLSSAAALTRRRSSIPAKSPLTQQAPVSGLESEDVSRSSHLSPHRYSRSPGGSPSRSKHRSRGSPKQMAGSSETPVIKVRPRQNLS